VADKLDVDLERASAWVYKVHKWCGMSPAFMQTQVHRLAAEFRAVRLEEAKWWNAKLFAVSKCDRETWDRLEKLEDK
jgi:hypothetical protein